MPPKIVTELPGPRAREHVELDHRYISKSYTRSYPLVASRGDGAYLEDVDGNRFLDFTAGIAVVSTGHCHPRVVEAIKKQAEQLIHMSGTDFYYPAQWKLAKKLCEVTPGDSPKNVFLSNSGTEAMECALKLARYHTKRSYLIAFYGAFHGRTMGSLSLTSSKTVQRERFAPLLPNVAHAPYAYCYRCPLGQKVEECDVECVKFIKEVMLKKSIPPDEVAAIVVEPIQGEGGYVVPPEKFHTRLAHLCQEYGILYVADEVQSGMGRTGKMFASQTYGVTPDIICMAKGIASGMPLGATVAPESIMDWKSGSHANTFGGNPVACEAALVTIDLLEQKLMDNAAAVGAYLLKELEKMKKEHEIIGDVRGKGLMIGIELVKSRETKEKAAQERDLVVQEAFQRGLLILGCGENAIRLSPPLVISKEDADSCLQILQESLSEVGDRCA